ncbi:paired amphipathic helix protein Sin3-like 3 isoform X1 [Hordeum vulgare subsp. vulgare]|uniref:Histone deacetylase interacting domain-containing protein n=2 Tax=Hordeum vulgare subsp. vulgare TaxID=112509 RepID=M0XQB0_HORVV|nr:paired amphipathic helix protein Sin3-like 3 isoform X1 [Hordeum vulgare subsp. vulgare]
MVSPNEADDDNIGHKKGKKEHTLETMQCLLFARENLPGDVYHEFVKTMNEIGKKRADPDSEIRNICPENCIETALKLFQGCDTVKQSFLNFTEGRSPIEGNSNVDADVEAVVVKNPLLQKPTDFLSRVKTCPYISDDDYAAFLQTMQDFCKDRTMTPREVYSNVERCMRNCPELLEEFVDNYLPEDLKASVKANDNHSLDGVHMKEGDEEGKVKPLREWTTSRIDELPPKVEPKELKRHCTPSYYLLPDNCIPLLSYRTKLGRSILNDALICPVSEEESPNHKTANEYEATMSLCEEDMFESDMLLQWFRVTADFIANLQHRVGSNVKIREQLTPLHRRCIIRLYGEEFLEALLDTNNASTILPIILSRLNRSIVELRDARLHLHKTCSEVIAKNYYKSLDRRGPSFKQLDAKRMSQKALLAEAKKINKMKPKAEDQYANPDIHKDISSIISSACASEEKQMVTWTKIVHPFLSAHCARPPSEETAAPEKACEHCGTRKHALNSNPDAFAATNLPLSSKRGEFLRKSAHDFSSSHDGSGADIEEGEFIPDPETIVSDVMLGARKPVSCDVAASVRDGLSSRWRIIDTSEPSTRDHWNKHEKKHESRQTSAKQRGVKGDTCCFLVVLRRLYQILYDRLQNARYLCTSDNLYAEFKEKLTKLLYRAIDNSNFEDFCLKFLGPMSFELFTLDTVINQVIKQLCIISSKDPDNSIIHFLGKLQRPILPNELPKHGREEQEKARDHTVKLPRHFERRKKRKLENGGTDSTQLGGVTETHH